MDNLKSYAYPAGRILMGLLFLMAGFGKTQMGMGGFGGYIESVLGFGAFLAWPVTLFEIIAGVFMIVGFQTRWTALVLAAFCVFTGVVFHGFSEAEMSNTLKNLALAGGFLAFFTHGAGKLAIDK